MTDLDFDKILWSTLYPIDKVVYVSDEKTITNSSVSGSYQEAHITTNDYTNDYGKKVFARAIWSFDGVSWKSTHSRVPYTFDVNYSGMFGSFSQKLSALKGAVSIGVSDSYVRILTGAGYHGNVAQDDVSDTYSSIPQTFHVKYALFEIE